MTYKSRKDWINHHLQRFSLNDSTKNEVIKSLDTLFDNCKMLERKKCVAEPEIQLSVCTVLILLHVERKKIDALCPYQALQVLLRGAMSLGAAAYIKSCAYARCSDTDVIKTKRFKKIDQKLNNNSNYKSFKSTLNQLKIKLKQEASPLLGEAVTEVSLSAMTESVCASFFPRLPTGGGAVLGSYVAEPIIDMFKSLTS